MNLIEVSKQALHTAESHGFKIGGDNLSQNLFDATGEIHEAISHYKTNGEQAWAYNAAHWQWIMSLDIAEIESDSIEQYLMNTIEMELADVFIRLLTIGAKYDLDFANSSHSTISVITVEHIESLYDFCGYCQKLIDNIIVRYAEGRVRYRLENITSVLNVIEAWFDKNGLDLEFFVALKMGYNVTREYKHI